MLRRRDATRSDVDPRVFTFGDGTVWPYHRREAYATRAEAALAWNTARRAAWRAMHVGRIPPAASEYDGLTAAAPREVERELSHFRAFRSAPIFAAIRCDRRNVAAFRSRNRTGAAQVRDILERWLKYLSDLEHAVTVFVEKKGLGETAPLLSALRTAERYGDRFPAEPR